MFDAGDVWVSPNILSFLSWEEIDDLVARHKNEDFGDVDAAQATFNRQRIGREVKKGRIRSIYDINGWRVLVSTIPGEYTNVVFEIERHRWANL